jgi:rubrerythrin
LNLEQAIATAIKYETRVHATYAEAAANAEHAVARRVFTTLRDEEMGHIRYLRERLEEWRAKGAINIFEIGSEIGTREAIEAAAARLRTTLAGGSPGGGGAEIDSLKKALDAERETSAFYKQMVAALDAEGRRLFERFVEIEEGHVAIVQAEMDLASGAGYWFDTAEFKSEAG